MIRQAAFLALLALLAAGCGDTAPADAPAAINKAAPAENIASSRAPEPLPDIVRVGLETEEGAIVVALDAKRAPVTAANFVRYAEEGRLDGTQFYRAAPTKTADGKDIKGRGFIQGGIRRNYRKMLPPIAHEPTDETGLRHVAGTISMARTEPGNAMGEFFIVTDAMPAMDAHGSDPGYAAFGRVVEGMDVVKRILAAPVVPNAGRGGMRGQMIREPVAILRVRRAE
jgi:peptidyl-prolyl cis-trans isomerase A (cyclophilin A)